GVGTPQPRAGGRVRPNRGRAGEVVRDLRGRDGQPPGRGGGRQDRPARDRSAAVGVEPGGGGRAVLHGPDAQRRASGHRGHRRGGQRGHPGRPDLGRPRPGRAGQDLRVQGLAGRRVPALIPRYTLPEMARVWAEETKLAHWLWIEVLAGEGWARLGRIPEEDLRLIRERATIPTPQRVAELENITNHDVAAFVQAVAEPIGPAGRWIHFGLTSSDLLDTALALQMRDSLDLILAGLADLLAVVKRRALEHRYTICMGRTHGVHAEPTTFGHKLAVWAFELDRDRERLRRAREGASVGK